MERCNNNPNSNYVAANEINYNTEIQSNLSGYNNAYILVTGDIAVTASLVIQVAFKIFFPFTKYITKIDGITIDDAEYSDLVIPMYNLIEYSSNYSETTGSLWFYSKDEATSFNADIANDNDKLF